MASSSSSSQSSFAERAERLLQKRHLYEGPEDFAREVGLYLSKDQEHALQITRLMAKLAQQKAQTRYLKRLAETLDVYQLVDRNWINSNVYQLASKKKQSRKPVAEYDPAKKVVDFRTLADPSFPTQTIILTNKEEDQLLSTTPEEEAKVKGMVDDIGSDQNVSLGSVSSPVASPDKLPMKDQHQPLAKDQVENIVRGSAMEVDTPELPRVDPVSTHSHLPEPTPRKTPVHHPTSFRRNPGSSRPSSRPSSTHSRTSEKENRRGEKRGSSGRIKEDRGSRQDVEERRSRSGRRVEYRRDDRVRQDRSKSSNIGVRVEADGHGRRVMFQIPSTTTTRTREEKRQSLHSLSELNARQRARQRYNEDQCYVSGCQDLESRKWPKMHAYNQHIPGVFDLRLPYNDPRVMHLRFQALKQAAFWLQGVPVDLQRLVNLINSYEMISKVDIHQETDNIFRAFHSYLELTNPAPKRFSIAPINSPAALLHWRCLNVMVSLFRRPQHDSWRTLFPMPDLSVDEPVNIAQVSMPPLAPPTPEAIDAHFHLDRLIKVAHLPELCVLEALTAGSMPEDRQVKVVGAVANFCDSETYPTTRQITAFPPELKFAIGYHPKHANRNSRRRKEDLCKMFRLLEDPRVIAIGEFGLDHSVRDTEWAAQNDVVRQILPRIQPHHIVVLHCRAMTGDSGREVHFLLQSLLKELPRTQKLHLHCFNGGPFVLEGWMELSHACYFSFNRGVAQFQDRQLEALKAIPKNRLLLETDAPYFCAPGNEYSAPNELFDVAELVAHHRGMSVFEVTRDNARRLYGWEA